MGIAKRIYRRVFRPTLTRRVARRIIARTAGYLETIGGMMGKDSVALVTGAARGIGAAIAVELARSGFDVAVFDVIDTSDTVSAVEAEGRCGLGISGDVTSEGDRKGAVEKIRADFGRLDCLVNNAGVAPKKRIDILEAEEESYDRVMNINLRGPYFLTRDAARWMVEEKERHPDRWMCIVNTASVSSYAASTARGEYCISKAGVSMATKLWAARLAEYGIGVYETRPGIIATDMTTVVKAKYDKLIAEGLTPIKRWGRPEDVAKAVGACARGELAFSTGQVIDVDGGFHLRIL